MDLLTQSFNRQFIKAGDLLSNFGRRVSVIRRENGLSQEQLAHKAGLHRTYIGGVERGERNVSLINIHRIAEALNVNVCALLGHAEAYSTYEQL